MSETRFFYRQLTDWLHSEALPYSGEMLPGCPFPVFLLRNSRGAMVRLVPVSLADWELLEEATRPLFLQQLVLSLPESQTIILWEDVWLRKKSLITSRILVTLGRFTGVPARLTYVQRIDKAAASAFLDSHHLHGDAAARYRYGLFLPARYLQNTRYSSRLPDQDDAALSLPSGGDRLLAVAAFSAPRNFERDGRVMKSVELIRYASLAGTSVTGGMDKLLTRFVKLHAPDDIMTYCDLEWSLGSGFQKLGFQTTGETAPLPFLVHSDSGTRVPEHRADAHFRSQPGLSRIFNAGNRKFVKIYNAPSPVEGNPAKSVSGGAIPTHETASPASLLFIAGPTASGKTALAVRLARELNGEIISIDSRQVYRGMDIGTGKDLEAYGTGTDRIPYHLIDIRNPGEPYNVFAFQEDFYAVLQNILSRGRIAVACGGSGLYLEAVLRHYTYGKRTQVSPSLPPYRVIGLSPDVGERRRLISERLRFRLENGLIDEVRKLLLEGNVTASQLEAYGLEYRFVTEYVLGRLSYESMYVRLETEIHRFAKRQMTYLRKIERSGIPFFWMPATATPEAQVALIRALANR